MKIKFALLTLGLIGASGCADAVDATNDEQASVPEIGAQKTALFFESFQLENGGSVHLALEADGAGSLLSTGPAGTQFAVQEKLSGYKTLSELYARLRPSQPIPAAVVEAENYHGLDINSSVAPAAANTNDASHSPKVNAADLSKLESQLAVMGAADGAAAPVGKTAWSAKACKEMLDEGPIRGDFWHKYDTCLERRTGNITQYYNAVRESYNAVEMYRGAGTVRVFTKSPSSSTWISSLNYTVKQGTWMKWLTWGGTAVRDVKFQILNVETDGYNWAAQTARTPIDQMPVASGAGSGTGDWVHMSCSFLNPLNGRTGTYWLEGCLDFAYNGVDLAGHPQPTWDQGSSLCNVAAFAYGYQVISYNSIQSMFNTNGTMCRFSTSKYKDCGSALCNCDGACPGNVVGM